MRSSSPTLAVQLLIVKIRDVRWPLYSDDGDVIVIQPHLHEDDLRKFDNNCVAMERSIACFDIYGDRQPSCMETHLRVSTPSGPLTGLLRRAAGVKPPLPSRSLQTSHFVVRKSLYAAIISSVCSRSFGFGRFSKHRSMESKSL